MYAKYLNKFDSVEEIMEANELIFSDKCVQETDEHDIYIEESIGDWDLCCHSVN